MLKGNIVGIDVYWSFTDVLLVGVDVNMVVWVVGELVMHEYVWLQMGEAQMIEVQMVLGMSTGLD